MRSLVFRYGDLESLRAELDRAEGQELRVPARERVGDGEWVLALFELEGSPRATAAAARGVVLDAPDERALVFEQRDWERLVAFAAPRPSSVPAPMGSTQDWEVAPASDPTVVQARRPSLAPGARVLIVDDDDDLREVIAAMLDAVGLVATGAPSAEDAWPRLLGDCPDLLVLDWNLPGESGLALCRRIRAQGSLRHVPVLFLTAHSATDDIVEAFAAGADDFVVKPFRAAELGARIFGLLRRTRST